MALNFPNSPSLNDTYTLGDKTWIYTGYGWRLQVTPLNYDHANGAFDAANTAQTTADSEFTAANTAQSHAEGAFTQANTNAGNISTNTTNITSAYNHANGAFLLANGTAGVANTDVTNVSVSADTYGNASAIPSITIASNGRITAVTTNSIDTTTAGLAYDHANGAFDAANTAQTHADGAFDAANTNATNITTAQNTADGAFTAANNAQTHAESAFSTANTNATNITTAQNHADGAFDAANTAQTTADAAFGQANTATTNASTAQTTADGAYAHANGAFDSANTKFASAGGTVSGFVNVTQNVSVGSYVDLNTAPSNPTHSEGRLFYDNTQKSLAYYNEDSEMTLQIGQETVVRVYNKSGATINNASVVRITGSDGAGFPAISLADATSAVNSEIIGMTTTEIANDSYGYVTTDGKVSGVDTSLLSDGVELFLSTTPGEYTTTVPATPNIAQAVGYVSSVGASGSILVNLHPMTGRNMTDGSIIFAENGGFDQDNADLYWDNTNKRLGINTNTPSANLHVVGTGLFTGNVEILGNLIITNAEAITTTTLNVGGNTIVLSDEVTGEPTVNAEIVINRGSSDNVSIRWDETTDEWVLIEASGVEGHILSDAKTFKTWAAYSTAETYEKAGYPIGADLANATHEQAVTANNLAAIAQAAGQGGYDHANGAFTAANTAQTTASAAFNQANTATTNAGTAQTTADGAYAHANGAFTKANTALVSGDIGSTIQAYDADLTALGGLAKTDGNFIVGNGTTWVAESGATARTSLGLGSIATQASSSVTITGGSITGITDLAVADGGTGASDAATARTNLGLAIGTNVQAYDADLTALGGLDKTDGNFIVGNGSTWVAESGATVRTSLGLGSIATQASSGVSITGGTITGITDLAVADGGTGASDAATARTNLGLAIGTNVQAYDADLTALAGLAKTDGNFIVGNGTTWVAESGATVRTSLGLGSLATASTISNDNWSGTDLAVVNGGTGASDAATARTNLGLAIGTNVQAYDADLTAIAGLAATDGNFIVGNGTTWVAESGATVRTSLGLGSLATLSSVGASEITDNSVGAAELNVSGNGTAGQVLQSDGDGTMSWADASGGITTGKAIAMAIVFG